MSENTKQWDLSIVERYGAFIKREAIRRCGPGDEAFDVLQETLRAVIEKGPLKEPHLGRFIRTVLDFKVADVKRARNTHTEHIRSRTVQLDEMVLPHSVHDSAHQDAIRAVQEAVQLLREPERSYVRLRMEGFTFQEIAKQLRRHITTIQVGYAQALVSLRKHLSDDQSAELRSGREQS